MCILSMADLTLQWQRGVVVTETKWPAKPKIVTIWPFTEKVCPPIVYWRRLENDELLEERD